MSGRALVTGASGFVGGYLIEYLQASGDTLMACDLDVVGRPPPALLDEPAVAPKNTPDPTQRGATAGLPSSVQWVRWNLAEPTGLDPDSRDRIEQFRPEVVYHLAAMSIPADCGAEEPTHEAVGVNVEGTRRVLDLAASISSRPRVLLVSTSHVYAPVIPEAPIVSEDSPVHPVGGYVKTKLAAEQVALEFAQQKGLDVVVIRAFQHTGPRQNPRMMLPEWARQFAESSGKPVKVHTLDAHIDLTDVRDVVRAYRLLVERGDSGRVYNVGSGVDRRSGDLFELLRAMAGPGRPVVELHPGRKQDPIADIARLAECTGWRPEIPIEKTISDTWACWRAEAG